MKSLFNPITPPFDKVSSTSTDVGLGNVDNVQQIPMSYLDTTTTLGTSDTKVPSQKAVKTYVDSAGGYTPPTTTALNDMQFGDGSGSWIKRTLADSKSALGVIADTPVNGVAYARKNASWVPTYETAVLPYQMVCSIDETVTSSTTLTYVGRVSNIIPITNYARIRGVFFYSTPAAADFKWALEFTGTGSMYTVRSHVLPGTTAEVRGFDIGAPPTVAMLSSVATGRGFFTFDTIVTNVSNYGYFNVLFAQNTSNAGNTSILSGSYVELNYG